MRQLVDAGTLSNLPGGFKTRGMRIKGDDTPIAPGEWRDIDIGSGVMRDNIMPLPYKEPSNVLYTLLGNIVEEGRRFAATADMKISDMSAQAPVGTTLALLERQLKVMSAVQARMHYAFKQELRLLAGIIRDYTDPDYDYDPDKGERRAKVEDYEHLDIIPVSDPNAATMSQRVVQYQAVMQMAAMAPAIYDMPQLHRNMLEVLGIKDADKLVPLPDDQKPLDPVTENMAILNEKPVKAFMYQDHKSHIQVHMSLVQDPIVAASIGQNPKAQAISAALMAHVADHAGFAYRQQIEQQLGMSLPPQDEKLPAEIEFALSGMMAQAANQVLQTNKAQQAQQQSQQQSQDPLVQMQMQDQQMKMQDQQLKAQIAQQKAQLETQKLQLAAQKVMLDAAAKQDQIELEQQKLEGHLQLESMRVGAQINESKAKMTAQQEEAGIRLGIDVAKEKAKQDLQARTTALNATKGEM